MTILQTTLSDLSKTQPDINQQLFINVQDIVNWSQSQNNQLLTNLKETLNNSTSSIAYIDIPKMNCNFSCSGNGATITYNLTLSGEGFIGIFINGTNVNENHFNHNATVSNFSFHSTVPVKGGSNNLVLRYKAVTGSINISDQNTLQVSNANI